MKNLILVLLALIISVCCSNVAIAQDLNNVTIGQCSNRESIDRLIKKEQKDHLVIDSRPFAINQAKGEFLYTGKTAQVSVVHMNPFVYSYRISVAQQELLSTALSEFLKLLLPPSLGNLSGLQSGAVGAKEDKRAGDRASLLKMRIGDLDSLPDEQCKANPLACQAIKEMYQIVKALNQGVTSPSGDSALGKLNNSTIPADFVSYSKLLMDVRDQQLDTWGTCDRAQKLNDKLHEGNYDDHLKGPDKAISRFDQQFDDLNAAQQEISRLVSLIQDLQQLITEFEADASLNTPPVRCKGFNCVKQISQYAAAVNVVLGDYQRKLTSVREKAEDMQKMFLFTDQLRERRGVFARTFTIEKRFELSEATITVARTNLLEEQPNRPGSPQAGVPGPTPASTPVVGNAITGSEGRVQNNFGQPFVPSGPQVGTPAPTPSPSPSPASGDNKPSSATALVGDVNEVIQLGRPRFKLSGGLVYSPLPRRTFTKVTGFVLDAEGNPTGTGDKTVVGFDQNSPRRLLPMVFLNSRLLDYKPGSLYFSFGITAKHDKNVDLEYLIGPSLSFLNDRALFTFGAYGGMTENLVSDVRIGQEIPDSLGNAEFFRKTMTWKPGFSFNYSFSRTNKGERTSGGGTGPAANDLKNEIHIGSIPFNLALGLAFTSLESRTYDEIAGLARDRQGNLTNGQNLARIVGLNSSSDYRLTPLALLHSRLTNFGKYDFYFTTGITGKKTDDDFDVEYLLGGSVNVYRRKVFLTFGTFIGKQQVLGANFFEGQQLGSSQNVTTEKRYVWKPAFAFSYDISRIIPRQN